MNLRANCRFVRIDRTIINKEEKTRKRVKSLDRKKMENAQKILDWAIENLNLAAYRKK
jgi:hypothetical protein